MSEQCGCQSHSPEAAQAASGLITADLRVGDVAHHYAGTLDIMKDMGINHCCGAHLTLREAAASAGIPLDRLLDALNSPAAVKA